MCHKKRKLEQISGVKPGTDSAQSGGWKTFFYPKSIMLQILTEDSAVF